MEQTSNNSEHNMTDKIIEQEVKHEEEVKQEEVKHEKEVVNHIENTTNNEHIFEEAKQAKTRTKPKPKSKPKPQHDTDTKLTKAEMKELADMNNQFHALLNGIDKIPNRKDMLTKERLTRKKTHIKVKDEIINLKDSSCIGIQIIRIDLNYLAKIKSNKNTVIYYCII